MYFPEILILMFVGIWVLMVPTLLHFPGALVLKVPELLYFPGSCHRETKLNYCFVQGFWFTEAKTEAAQLEAPDMRNSLLWFRPPE